MTRSLDDAVITINCPISAQLPQAGIPRPTFDWKNIRGTRSVSARHVTYDTAYINNREDGTDKGSSIRVSWSPSYGITDEDKKAADLIARILTGQYHPSTGLTVVTPDPPPGGVPPGHYLVITSANSNGPMPLKDFEAADATLSGWTRVDDGSQEGHNVVYEYNRSQ